MQADTIVRPASREELQEIVREAAARGCALRPRSSASADLRSRGEEGIVVDFTGMDKIRKIDAYSRYAWIEPGVTFGQLLPELRERGLKLNHPLLPRADASVLTTILEREPVIMPKYQYDNIDPLMTVEAVYGTGDDFRTGSASGPGPFESLKADKVNPWGPGSVDFVRFLSAAQGTMGFVTWAVVKTEIAPRLTEAFFVVAEELAQLSGLLSGLLRRRAVDECIVLNRAALARVPGMQGVAGVSGISPAVAKLPEWALLVSVAGYERYPEERLRIQKGYLDEFCAKAGLCAGAELHGTGVDARTAERIFSGLRGDGGNGWKRSGVREIFFLCPISRAPDFEKQMAQLATGAGFATENLGVYVQPLVQGRCCHVEFDLFFDETDTGARDSADRLFHHASRALIDADAFFSRPYGSWAGPVFAKDPVGTEIMRKVKGIYDPKNILNPGMLCF